MRVNLTRRGQTGTEGKSYNYITNSVPMGTTHAPSPKRP
jgi:hypothetical protein